MSAHEKTETAPTITERLYKGLFNVKSTGMDPKAIYLGQGFRPEFDKIFRYQVRYDAMHSEETEKFFDVPIYWVVSPHDHFYIAGGFSKWHKPRNPT